MRGNQAATGACSCANHTLSAASSLAAAWHNNLRWCLPLALLLLPVLLLLLVYAARCRLCGTELQLTDDENLHWSIITVYCSRNSNDREN
jgi:hypothetical protein